MVSCGPGGGGAASGASPVKFGVNVGPAGLPPTSVQIGAVVHWLLTSPIRESVTADKSSVIARSRQPCAIPYQRRSPSCSRSAPAPAASCEVGRGQPFGGCAGGRVSPGSGAGGADGTTATSIVPIDTRGRTRQPGTPRRPGTPGL